MVSHKRLQHYKRHYGKTCMTGLYGCRWHRYQQSRDSTSTWNTGWFVVLILTFLYMLVWLCFWVTAYNSTNLIHEVLQQQLGVWFEWHTLLMITTSITFAYVTLLLFLGLLHAGSGHEMYMHKIHKFILLFILAGCITLTNIVTELWSDGWTLLYLALWVNWPFIHIGVVVAMTLLTFLVAKRWMYLYSIGAQVVILTVYVSVMLFIYMTPLLVRSPCICNQENLPDKPQLIAHRGGAALAPENTLLAFNWSSTFQYVNAFECDVMISYDGVPFLLHDLTLKRTTNVEEVFPGRQNEPAYNFNISDLKRLDAGSWFLERDPYGRFVDLSDRQQQEIANQEIPTLEELLQQVLTTNKSLLFHIQHPPPSRHPYAAEFMQIIVNTTKKSGLPYKKVLWPYYNHRPPLDGTEDFTPVAEAPLDPETLLNDSIRHVNIGFKDTNLGLISLYSRWNISNNIFTVNSWWLYSFLWCAGVKSVTTNEVASLSGRQEPTWIMSDLVSFVLWVVVDVVSAVAVVIIFIYNRVKKSGTMFNPETLSLQAMHHRMTQTRHSRNMKEKLLHTAESMQDVENGIIGIVTPTTPATPITPGTEGTVDTPTTPVSLDTPDVVMEKDGHQNRNISFSCASGFFRESGPSGGQDQIHTEANLGTIKEDGQ